MTVLITKEKAELFVAAHEDKNVSRNESDGYPKPCTPFNPLLGERRERKKERFPMLYEDRKKEIETVKERTLVLKLSDADCDRILQKAASHGMTVSGLLESFIGDLVDGTFTNGSDERYLAEDWFNRCGFERDDKRTLLWHLLEQHADLENFIELYEENEEYKSHPEEFEEQREEYEMEPGATFWFEEELQYCLDDWKPSRLSMAEEVEAIRDYVQTMKNFKGE